tara:strand:+ start:1470 stop:1718 length:249 start_codon:yes stop_codon:yes gene_type:complete
MNSLLAALKLDIVIAITRERTTCRAEPSNVTMKQAHPPLVADLEALDPGDRAPLAVLVFPDDPAEVHPLARPLVVFKRTGYN